MKKNPISSSTFRIHSTWRKQLVYSKFLINKFSVVRKNFQRFGGDLNFQYFRGRTVFPIDFPTCYRVQRHLFPLDESKIVKLEVPFVIIVRLLLPKLQQASISRTTFGIYCASIPQVSINERARDNKTKLGEKLEGSRGASGSTMTSRSGRNDWCTRGDSRSTIGQGSMNQNLASVSPMNDLVAAGSWNGWRHPSETLM